MINFQKLKLGIPELKFVVAGDHQFSILHHENFPRALIKNGFRKLKLVSRN